MDEVYKVDWNVGEKSLMQEWEEVRWSKQSKFIVKWPGKGVNRANIRSKHARGQPKNVLEKLHVPLCNQSGKERQGQSFTRRRFIGCFMIPLTPYSNNAASIVATGVDVEILFMETTSPFETNIG